MSAMISRDLRIARELEVASILWRVPVSMAARLAWRFVCAAPRNATALRSLPALPWRRHQAAHTGCSISRACPDIGRGTRDPLSPASGAGFPNGAGAEPHRVVGGSCRLVDASQRDPCVAWQSVGGLLAPGSPCTSITRPARQGGLRRA